jgi:methionyl-tRNA formyltransferase
VKIAFFGLPLCALLLRADGHDVVYAGICRRAAIGTRRLRRALPGRVFVLPNLEDAATRDRIASLGADLLVSWYWTKKIPRVLRDAFPLGTVGAHPSLLPRHRGSDPFFWAIDAGDGVTGVTAHRLDDEYDTGAILDTRELRIDPAWTSWRLAKKLDRPSLALMRDVVSRFARGAPPKEQPQDESRATIANEPNEDELEIDWTWPAARVVRRIRAASPFPGAFTFIGDEAVTVTRAAVASDAPRALAPGEAAVVSGRAIVRAGDSGVQLLEGRVERAVTQSGERGDDVEKEVELDEMGLAEIVANASRLP